MASSRRCPRPRCVLALLAAAGGCPRGALAECPSNDALAPVEPFAFPVANPGLIAPAVIRHHYPVLSHPLAATLTDRGLSVRLPRDYPGGFELRGGAGALGNESFALRRLEVRLPGHLPSARYTREHVLEASFLHREVGGGRDGPDRWANVVVPFGITAAAPISPLSILEFAELPTSVGERATVLTSANQELDLSSVFGGASFLHFWGSLPTACPGETVRTRFLMRRGTVPIADIVFRHVAEALRLLPATATARPPALTWIVDACSSAETGCNRTAPLNFGKRTTLLRQQQHQAVEAVRKSKAAMDVAISRVENKRAGAYSQAVSARDVLRAMDARLTRVKRSLAELRAWEKELAGATWDDAVRPAPRPLPASPTAPGSGAHGSAPAQTPLPAGAQSSLSLVAPPTPQPDQQAPAKAAGGAGGSAPHTCDWLGKSPADLRSRAAAGPRGAGEPIAFQGLGPAPSGSLPALMVARHAGRLRIAPSSGAPVGPKALPLGAIVTGGLVRPVSFLDVVVPGQHAIDGEAGDAELHLVHFPSRGPAVAVALRLAALGDAPNPWLEALLERLPGAEAERPLEPDGPPLSAVHSALSRGSASSYFRYDGTLTTPPCSGAQWYVLAEPGHVSRKQLAALRSSLGVGGASKTATFSPSLLAKDQQILAAEPISGKGGNEAVVLGARGTFRRGGRRNLPTHEHIQM